MNNEILTMIAECSFGILDIFCIIDGCGLETHTLLKDSVSRAVAQILPQIIRQRFAPLESPDRIDRCLRSVFSDVEQALHDLANQELRQRILHVMKREYNIDEKSRINEENTENKEAFFEDFLQLIEAYREVWKCRRVEDNIANELFAGATETDFFDEEAFAAIIGEMILKYNIVFKGCVKTLTKTICKACQVSTLFDVQGAMMQILVLDAKNS